jgi:hydroxymethylpyrimidine pyrophosphatase-like HAD family hydrolase
MSKDKVGMIMNREATKINAIRKICIREHIELGEVVCFGDDSNDLEMIRQCGLGVAVANAKEDVLSVADESASEIV